MRSLLGGGVRAACARCARAPAGVPCAGRYSTLTYGPLSAARHASSSRVAAGPPTHVELLGSNMQLDPRGVDYSLFEAPDTEYDTMGDEHTQHAARATAAAAEAGDVDAVLPPPAALLRRMLLARQYADATRALEQLQALHTPLGPPLSEYVLAARWCAASGRAEDALRWLTLCPPLLRSSEQPGARGEWDGRPARGQRRHRAAVAHQLEQTYHWLCRADSSAEQVAVRQACFLAAERGYESALRIGLVHVYGGRWARSAPTPWDYWISVVDRLGQTAETATGAGNEAGAARSGGPTPARLARLYNTLLRALVRAGHWHDALDWAARSTAPDATPPAYPLDPRTFRVLLAERRRTAVAEQDEAALPSLDAALRSHAATALRACPTLDARVRTLLASGDLVAARDALRHAALPRWRPGAPVRVPQAPALPSVETLARFLCAVYAERQVGGTASGRFLRPLRQAINALSARLRRAGHAAPIGLWETALLRSRELAGDPAGVLRVFEHRFQPVAGLDTAALAVRAERSRDEGDDTLAHAVAAHSAARRPPQRALRARLAPSSEAVAVVLRTLLGAARGDRAAAQRLYRQVVAAGAERAGPRLAVVASDECFAPFIAALSSAAPHTFCVAEAGPSLTLWDVLYDMHTLGVTPRPRTWTLVLQALARDGRLASWQTLVAMLERMHAQTSLDALGPQRVLALFAPPAATAHMYTGVLQVLLAHGSTDVARVQRARQLRNVAVRHGVAERAAEYAPLQAQLAELERRDVAR